MRYIVILCDEKGLSVPYIISKVLKQLSQCSNYDGQFNTSMAPFTYINFNPSLSAGWNYLSIPKFQPLKFCNEYIISSHTLCLMLFLIHGGIKVNPS